MIGVDAEGRWMISSVTAAALSCVRCGGDLAQFDPPPDPQTMLVGCPRCSGQIEARIRMGVYGSPNGTRRRQSVRRSGWRWDP